MVSIQVQDDVAAALAERAKQSGLSVTEFLSAVADNHFGVLGQFRVLLDQPSGAQLESLLRTEAANHPVAIPPTGTFSRDELYRDHD